MYRFPNRLSRKEKYSLLRYKFKKLLTIKHLRSIIYYYNIYRGAFVVYRMSNQTKENIKYITGLTTFDINKMDVLFEDEWVKQQTGRSLMFSNKIRHGIIGRGNPLLSRKKIRTMDYIDKKIDSITKVK